MGLTTKLTRILNNTTNTEPPRLNKCSISYTYEQIKSQKDTTQHQHPPICNNIHNEKTQKKYSIYPQCNIQ